MTLAQLRTSVSAKLGLNTTAAGTEEIELDKWLNQGVLEILLRTHCFVVADTITTAADDWQYEVATDILAIRKFWREDAQAATLDVEQVSVNELIELRRGNPSTGGTFTRYALEGANLLLLYPTPSAVYTLQLLAVPRPTAMSTGANDPAMATYGGIPAEYHKAIEYYALWQGAEFDENRTSQGGERFRALYEASLAEIRKQMNVKGGRRISPARIRGRRRAVISDPSQTW